MTHKIIVTVGILFFTSLFFNKNADCQIIESNYLWKIAAKGEILEVDNFGNLYLVSGNKIWKYSIDGKLLKEFTGKPNENIARLDVSNPMKIMAYNFDFNNIQFFDQNLQTISKAIYLDDFGITSIKGICNSSQNGFWVINNFENCLQLIDFKGKTILQSPKINNNGNDSEICYLSEANGSVFFMDNALFQFDTFGVLEDTYKIPHSNTFQVLNGEFLSLIDNKIHLIVIESGLTLLYNMQMSKKIIDFKKHKDRVIILTEKSCVCYIF